MTLRALTADTSDHRAVLSIDFESFAHTPAYRGATGTVSHPEDIGPESMDRLLSTFDDHDAAATFFVVSEVAQRHPQCISAAADAGHEIASHTHSHPILNNCSQERRREELSRSREILTELTGASVDGFRAPAFKFGANHFTELTEAGYEYDSSVAPCRSIPGWYGGESSVIRPTSVSGLQVNSSAELTELPIAVMPGLRLPLTGTWLRFFGVRYTLLGMHLLAQRGVTPVLYIHPWELSALPRVAGVPRRVYVRTGTWLWQAVERLLDSAFDFVTAREVVEDAKTPRGKL